MTEGASSTLFPRWVRRGRERSGEPSGSEPVAPGQDGRPLRVLFAVQGEGRGHMTQALALADMLRTRGHEVCRVVIGMSGRFGPPAFFLEEIGAPTTMVPSPGFALDERGGVRAGKTFLDAMTSLPRYLDGIRLLTAAVEREEPDVVVNFYEVMAGLWKWRTRNRTPVVAIGHQFMFEHPQYPFVSGQHLERIGARLFTRLIGAGAARHLALSYYDAPPVPGGRHRVVPPLLRRGVLERDTSVCDGSLLVYLVRPEMAEGIKAWSRRRPGQRIHCFRDGPPCSHSASLDFHSLDGEAFLAHMARARGVACTAGFESVAEARWLGKPVFIVPVRGHFEQQCNANDVQLHDLGLTDDLFDLDRFVEHLATPPPPDQAFRQWVRSAEVRIIGEIEAAVRESVGPTGDSH